MAKKATERKRTHHAAPHAPAAPPEPVPDVKQPGSGQTPGADLDQARTTAQALLATIDEARTALGNNQAVTFLQMDGIKAGAAAVLAALGPAAT